MNKWLCSPFLSCFLIIVFGSTLGYAQTPFVTEALGAEGYNKFEAENADGYLSIEITLGELRVEKCDILYRKYIGDSESTPVKSCEYNVEKGNLNCHFQEKFRWIGRANWNLYGSQKPSAVAKSVPKRTDTQR